MTINNTQPAPVQQPVYSDLSDTFDAHPVTDDLLLVVGISSVVQSVTNLVQTNHYERPFAPQIGGNVNKLLFELATPTTAALLATEITDVIENFEPRANVIAVNVQAQTTPIPGYSVDIVFSVLSSQTPVNIGFFLKRLA